MVARQGRVVKVDRIAIGLFRVFIFWYHERRFAATIGIGLVSRDDPLAETVLYPRR